MARHSAHPADPITNRAHDLGQILGADEDQRKDRDDCELGGIDAEHGGALTLSELRRLAAAERQAPTDAESRRSAPDREAAGVETLTGAARHISSASRP